MIKFDVIKAKGHFNVRAKHRTTLEITKDDYLTPRGDCIIGILSDKGAKDISEETKKLLKRDETYVYLVIHVEGLTDIIRGRGSSKLKLTDPNRMIFRKSNYICEATVMINSDKSAKDINREIVRKLRTDQSNMVAILLTSDSPLKMKRSLE